MLHVLQLVHHEDGSIVVLLHVNVEIYYLAFKAETANLKKFGNKKDYQKFLIYQKCCYSTLSLGPEGSSWIIWPKVSKLGTDFTVYLGCHNFEVSVGRALHYIKRYH